MPTIEQFEQMFDHFERLNGNILSRFQFEDTCHLFEWPFMPPYYAGGMWTYKVATTNGGDFIYDAR